MKKLMTFLMMSILAIGVGWAGTITFADLGLTNGNQYLDPFDGGDFTVTFAGGSNDGKYYTTGNGIRVYGGGRMTISAKSGIITEISITYDTTGDYFPNSSNVVNVGTYNTSSGVWTGSANTVVFTRPSGSGHWRVQSITVTLSGTNLESVATPTFSVPAGTYTNAQSVSINCDTEGASIYYTTNGNTPDENSTEYTNSINVSETTTIKAVAVKSGMNNSAVAEATYIIRELPDGVIFYESFDRCDGTGGNDGSWSGSIASNPIESTNLDNSGWTISKTSTSSSTNPNVFSANKCVRTGQNTIFTTPAISVTQGRTYTLTFKAAAWNTTNESTNLKLYCDGGTLSASVQTLVKGSWTDYTITITATTSEMAIGFGGNGASNSRFFLDEVSLSEDALSEVATPVITLDPAEGPYNEGSSVTATITCATEGANISYSTDGTNWSNYTQALTITETTTIQAKAVLNNVESLVASKTVTFVEAPTTVANIAGFIDLNEDKEFTFTGDVVVTYVNNSNRNYIWIKDASGSALIYQTGLNASQGSIIKGGWNGKKEVYNGLLEITNTSINDASFEGSETVTPAELTLADVTTEKQATYGWLRGVTVTAKDGRNFTISDGTSSVAGYNTYNNDNTINVPEANDGKTYDILGIVNVHNTPQFTPVQFVQEPEPDYYLVGSFNMNGNDWVQQDENYKFTLSDDGRYVLNGVECPDNVEFKILKVKGTQTTWCGGPADGNVYGIHSEWYKDIPLTVGGGKNYKIDAAGTFNFTMTIDDNNGNKFTVIKSPVVIRGSFDNWSDAGVEMDVVETGGWTITKELAASAGFGFRDGWGNWHGYQKTVTPEDYGTGITIGTENNYVMQDAGNYTIVVNSDMTKLVVTKILTPYNIVVESGIEGGTIAIKDNKTTAVVGETVTILVTPNENYALGNLVVTNSNTQQAIEVTEDYTFVMPDADVLVSGEFVETLEAMFNFDTDYATLFPTILGTSSNSSDEGDITEDVTATVDGVSLTVSPNPEGTPNRIWNASPRLRMYGGTITITAPNGYMLTGIDINQGKWPSGTAEPNSVSTGTLTSTKWTGSTQTLIIYIGSNTQFKSMNVTYCDIPDDQVMEPLIEGETPFLETTTVTITCSTEGAEIRYTLNGQDPTAESTLYTEPFTINEAVTVKAIAFKNGNSSSIASKAFEQIPLVATIADYLALDDNTTFVFTGNAVVTYHNGSNTWIKDETGFALIFASDQPDYSNGDVIPSRWGGKKTTYNNVPEITNPTELETATETSEAIPVVKTVADITTGDVNAYYQIKDIALSANSNNFNIVDGEKELVGYNKFNITMPEDVEDKSFNVVGVITIYNNKPEFYIISYEEILQPVALDGVVFTADRQWATWYGEEDLSLPNSDVKAYVVTGVEGDAVVVEEIDYIPSRVGVLLYSTKADSNLTAEIYTGDSDDIESDLKGVVEEGTVDEPAYVLYNNQFVLLQEGTTVGAHRCYLPASALEEPGQPGEPTGAPVLRIAMPGTVTAINDLRYDSNGKAVGYYDLTGRYIGTSLNGKRGIFITSDGKKVVK